MTFVPMPPALIVDHTEPPPGSWEREGSHFPLPLSPFAKVLMRQEEWARELCDELGSLIETVQFIEIGGWVYSRVVPFGGRFDRPPPPSWLIPILFRAVPSIRRRIRAAKTALDTDWAGRQIDAWYGEWHDALGARLATALAVNTTVLDDSALDEHLRSSITLAHDSFIVHFRLHLAIANVLRAFTSTCSDLLGWDDERSLSVLTGTSTSSTEAGRALADLARVAGRSAQVCTLLASAPTHEVLAADPEFAAAFSDYAERFCFRALTYDVRDPTLAERPELVLNLVRDQLADGRPKVSPGDGAPLIAEARARLATAPAQDRARFERTLTRALRAYPVREDNVYPTVSAPVALLRSVGLEMGRRLADRGQLDAIDDVFLLLADEARSALLDGADAREIVGRHRNARHHTLAHPGPPTFGPPLAARPSLRGIPVPARTLTEDGLWLIDLVMTAPPRQQPGDQLITGVPGARGAASGPVRIVMDENEFDKLQAGDVLVCPCTSPTWSIVFPSIAAVVTDSGGILSHPAIVAREFGIPAVVATGAATTRLRDGQRVIVDGSAGSVRIEP